MRIRGFNARQHAEKRRNSIRRNLEEQQRQQDLKEDLSVLRQIHHNLEHELREDDREGESGSNQLKPPNDGSKIGTGGEREFLSTLLSAAHNNNQE